MACLPHRRAGPWIASLALWSLGAFACRGDVSLPDTADGGGRGGRGGGGGTQASGGAGGSGSAGRGGSGAGGTGGIGGTGGTGGAAGTGGRASDAATTDTGPARGPDAPTGTPDSGGSTDVAPPAADARLDGAGPDRGVDAAPIDAALVDAPAGADPEPGKLAGFTRLHNQLRATVGVPPLMWDAALASVAQAYAQGCQFQHSGRDGVGENLAANAPAPPGSPVAMAFRSWSDEQAFYDYAGNSCAAGKQCGHYTQVVWRTTTRLGCGVAACTTGSPFTGFPNWELWVCNYAPPGNVSGQRPY
jgi:pathogenesis-related protein 1